MHRKEHIAVSYKVYRLLERHQRLDELLRRELSRRWADPFRIAQLKKLKLAVRDRIAHFSRQPARQG